MSNSRESVSRSSLTAAGHKNLHCRSVLKHELESIDKEREHLLHNIRHDAKHFRQQFQDHSDSSGTRPNSARASPPRHASGSAKSPRSARNKPSATGSRSREAQRADGEQVLATESGSNTPSPGNSAPGKDTMDQNHLPQIIVSDATEQAVGGCPTSARQKQGNKQRSASPGSPARSGSDAGSDTASPLSQSLNLPSSRLRSNSMPYVSPSQPSRPPASPDPTPSSDLNVPDSSRSRSSSFSGIQPARRRGSIVEHWGSISERNRPVMGSFKGRRGSVDMENLLRDLSFGVQHSEPMAGGQQRSKVSDKQWEELKKCRYLRMPSRENSEEDISEHGE